MAGWGVTVTLRHVPADHASVDDEASLIAFVHEARSFVRDLADLCWLLRQETDVVRGSVRAWLTPATFVSRQVKALALARQEGVLPQEHEILALLHSGRKVSGSYSSEAAEDILSSARRWAAEFRRSSGEVITI